jgi:hypothetical protein
MGCGRGYQVDVAFAKEHGESYGRRCLECTIRSILRREEIGRRIAVRRVSRTVLLVYVLAKTENELYDTLYYYEAIKFDYRTQHACEIN